MASQTHQVLLLWIARKMTYDGLRVIRYDGISRQGGGWSDLPPPPTIGGIRPDVVGQTPDGRLVAFGEAKTLDDLDTPHTRIQLRALAGARMRPMGTLCRIYVAVPISAIRTLDRVLADVGLVATRRVVRLHVPDILLQEVEAA